MTTTTEERLDRRTFIGSSDAAVIVGMSHFRTRVDLWEEKTGDEPVYMDEGEETQLQRAGKALESGIRQMALKDLSAYFGCSQLAQECNVRKVHPDIPFIRSEADAIVRHVKPDLENGGPSLKDSYVLEIKNSQDRRWGEPWSDEVPEYYRCQALIHMAVHQVDLVIFAVLRGGWRMEYFRIERDDKHTRLGQSLLKDIVDFWEQNVLKKIPPEPRSEAEARKLWHTGSNAMQATEGLKALCEMAAESKLLRDKYSDQYDAQKERIIVAMKDREELVSGNETLVTYRNTKAVDFVELRKNRPDVWEEFKKESLDINRLKKERPEIHNAFRHRSKKRLFLLKLKAEDES